MKIAYITNYDSGDIRQWSGLGYYMAESLKKQGAEIYPINCFVPFTWHQRLRRRLVQVLQNKVLQLERGHGYLKKMAARAQSGLARIPSYDIIFSPGSLPVSFLKAHKPIVIFTDATYDCLMKLYSGKIHLSQHTVAQANEAEAKAIKKASLIFYASDWARKNAIDKYGASEAKTFQLPFGANLECDRTLDDIKALVAKRRLQKKTRFLFLGVDWERKGGGLAVDTIAQLRKRGIDAKLVVAGCTQLPDAIATQSFVEYHSFIPKNTSEGVERLKQLYENASFFLMPTKAECFGVVFSEASSFGLPIITSNVGGCPSAVANNYNGFCIDLSFFAETAVEKIIYLHKSAERYKAFSIHSFQRYTNELNWDVIGKKMLQMMQAVSSD